MYTWSVDACCCRVLWTRRYRDAPREEVPGPAPPQARGPEPTRHGLARRLTCYVYLLKKQRFSISAHRRRARGRGGRGL